MLRIVFDVPNLVAKKKDLEQIAAQPEFWGNQADAKKHMLNLDDVRDQLQLLDKWKMFISDAEASLELYSHTKLGSAIHLYRKFGFVETPLPKDCVYERANIRMVFRG